ncbi:MAG: YceI family protein [Deltaproteobacteria bacterium]|nr:YceI family protein [Deltaproteobacteria bacterium]MBN2672618.1 YceI family protein [Deltaproteobacteria bacterium]
MASCSPKDNSPKAAEPPKAVSPEASTPTEAAPTVTGTMALSPRNASIEFLGEKLVGSHEGKFESFSGNISFRDSDPTTAKVDVKIDMSSVKTDAEKLDAHLQSADFFDVAKFPDGTFVSNSVTPGGSRDATHTVHGKLTLRGVTKEIAIPAKIEISKTDVLMRAEVTINRKDYGIAFPGMPDNLIKDDVKIFLKLDGKLQQ